MSSASTASPLTENEQWLLDQTPALERIQAARALEMKTLCSCGAAIGDDETSCWSCRHEENREAELERESLFPEPGSQW